MPITSSEIIKDLEKAFPEQEQVQIRNISDSNLQIQDRYQVQYIIGWGQLFPKRH